MIFVPDLVVHASIGSVLKKTCSHGAGALSQYSFDEALLDFGTTSRLNYRRFPRITVIDPAGSVYMPSGVAAIVPTGTYNILVTATSGSIVSQTGFILVVR